MSAYAGVLRILRFNWPWYAASILFTALAVVGLDAGWLTGPAAVAVASAFMLANGWLLTSLVVSHLIYDRSPIARGGWLDHALPAEVVIIHAGHDEASAQVARRFPGLVPRVFDVFDAAGPASASLLRARAAAAVRGIPVPAGSIPLDDGSTGLALVIFAAHELRDHASREGLFRELGRIAGARGRVVVVEHQRDLWNLLAYGPGCLHFLSHRTWMRTFARAGLQVARDDAITPWVRRFELRRAA